MNHPCVKACPDRSGTCRKTCQKWKEYEARKKIEEERKRQRYLLRDMLGNYAKQSVRRNRCVIYER